MTLWFGSEGAYTGSMLETTDVPHGYGQLEQGEREWYRGHWEYGARNGIGKAATLDAVCCVAIWRNGMMHGPGIVRYRDGRVYRGELKNNLPHGEGWMRYPDGEQYSGSWKKGKPHGAGYTNVYAGTFKHGKYHGNGTLQLSCGVLHATFKDGQKHGTASLIYDSGPVFCGSFDHDRCTGPACFFSSSWTWQGTFTTNKGSGLFLSPSGSKAVDCIWDPEQQEHTYSVDGVDLITPEDDDCVFDHRPRDVSWMDPDVHSSIYVELEEAEEPEWETHKMQEAEKSAQESYSGSNGTEEIVLGLLDTDSESESSPKRKRVRTG